MTHASPPRGLLILNGDDVRRLMPVADCIEVVDETMRTVSQGGAVLPLRIGAVIPQTSNIVATMPGYLQSPASLGAKVIAVYPTNAQRGLSSHMGVVVLFDPEQGVATSILDAAAITALRTAAASAVATRALARKDAQTLAIIGTGEQAETHLHSMSLVRKLRSVVVWGRSPDKAQAFAKHAGARLGLPITVAKTVEEAVSEADIVCTVTNSREPILQGVWVRRGTHVNLVGASAINAREADAALVMKSKFYVDFRPSAMAQAGELHAAIGDHAELKARHILGEIGDVLNGTVPGRTDSNEITVYKSLGIAAQDLATGQAVYERALEQGVGTKVSF